MRAMDRKGKDFQEYFQQRLIQDLREVVQQASDLYYTNNPNTEPEDYDELIHRIDKHLDFVKVMEGCGLKPNPPYDDVNKRLFNYSHLLGMGALCTGEDVVRLLYPALEYCRMEHLAELAWGTAIGHCV